MIGKCYNAAISKPPFQRLLVCWRRGQGGCGFFASLRMTLIGVAFAFAQQSDIIVLQNADVFSGKQLPSGESVRELTGNVRFKQGNVRVWCDKAIQFLDRNEIELIGSVKIIRDTVILTSNRGRYYGNQHKADGEGNVKLKTPNVTLFADVGTYYIDEKKAFFQRNVRIVDSATTIFSQQLTYFEKERKSIALLNVKIVNSSNNVTMFGNYLEHFDSTDYSKMTEDPRLMQIDTTEKGEIDTLAVKSLVMESYDDSAKKLIATDSVVIVRGGLAARCGLVYYYTKEERIELYQKPIVWYDENQVTGDTVFLTLEKNRLKTASVLTRAFVLSQSDSLFPMRYNQLTGRTITLTFNNNKLQQTYVERNAVSLYFLYDDREPNGANKTSGDFILMKFNNGKPNTIHVSQGIEGSYYPENVIKRDESQYNLDGFRLYGDRPTYGTVFLKRQKL
jgi:lipopolysaccharide export system protein LptA